MSDDEQTVFTEVHYREQAEAFRRQAASATRAEHKTYLRKFAVMLDYAADMAKSKRVFFCQWCRTPVDTSSKEPATVLEELRQHDLTCPNNPLVKEVNRLVDALMEAQASVPLSRPGKTGRPN